MGREKRATATAVPEPDNASFPEESQPSSRRLLLGVFTGQEQTMKRLKLSLALLVAAAGTCMICATGANAQRSNPQSPDGVLAHRRSHATSPF